MCSVHFKEDDFEVSLRQRLLNYIPKNARTLLANAVPFTCLNLNENCKRSASDSSNRRSERLTKRQRRSLVKDALLQTQLEVPDIRNQSIVTTNKIDETPINIENKDETLPEE